MKRILAASRSLAQSFDISILGLGISLAGVAILALAANKPTLAAGMAIGAAFYVILARLLAPGGRP